MPAKTLMLIGPTAPGTGAGLINQVLQHWPEADCPPVCCRTIDEVLNAPSILDDCAVAWVLLDQPEVDDLYDLVGLLQDLHLSALLTRPGETNAIGATFLEGVVTAPPSAAPSAVAVMLRTLWSQADVLNALKVELSILRLHSDGVGSEFDKIDQELRMAAKLQRDLLPTRFPTHAGVQFSALYRPARYVSGDIYAVTQLDEKHIGFFLADAVGHGVPAALMTVFIRSALSVCQRQGETDASIVPPNEVLARLNRAVIHYETEQVRTATAVYGLLNTESRHVRIARAGHPYPLVFSADGTMTRLGPEGAILGVFADEQFELLHVQLEPGDRMVLFSDGFETAFPQVDDSSRTELSGRQRGANDLYLDAFNDLARGPIDQALKQLTEKLDLQIGSLNQCDDLTVLMIGIDESHGRPAAVEATADLAGRC